MTKKTAKKKAVKPKPVAKKGPRQKSLPGMEDRAISALQNAALSYAEARDARVACSSVKVERKKQLLGLMHAHKKKRYQHGNVFIEIVPEGEKLKVKILKDGEDAPEAAPADEPEPDVVDDAEEVLDEQEEYEEEEPEEVAEP